MEYLKYLVDNECWYFELDEDRYATKQIVIDDKGYHLCNWVYKKLNG